jgi:hypothetical protein
MAVRKSPSQIAIEGYAQAWGVDDATVWRVARPLKEAKGETGARLDLWTLHPKGGGGGVSPKARHMVNLLFAWVPAQPASAVDAVLKLRRLVPGKSYGIVSTPHAEASQRNRLMPPEGQPQTQGVLTHRWESTPTEIPSSADYLEGLIEEVSQLTAEARQAWMLETSKDWVEFDLNRGVMRVCLKLTGDGIVIQDFVDPQADLLAVGDEGREERIVRFPYRYLGVAAELLAQFRAKGGSSKDLPPSGSASPAEPQNEDAPSLPGLGALTRTDGRRLETDTGTTTNSPDNRSEKLISQSRLSVSERATRGQLALEPRAA